MAIVIDPDNLDRDQVIFGTETQRVSLYPVGAITSVTASSNNATVSTGATAFIDPDALFTTTFDVNAGDILVLRNGADAAHYTVSAVVNASTLELATDDGFTGWSADGSALVYAVHNPTGGSIEDGVTKQALYSFAKEEWRTDTYATALSDDLIRHEFPFEAITSEQFEIGGGDSHKDWDYQNEYTRKKIRTGGWAKKDAAASTNREYTGIITLGSLDTDAQVYYQQVSAQNDPVNFTFQGVVNEAIPTLSSTAFDYTTFLKLFVRKKGKTYAGSEIADIGVTNIQTIVNRFPLAHSDDAAIVASDAAILGTSPFRSAASVVTASAGVTSAISSTVGSFRDSAAAPFTASAVVVGDALFITGTQTDAGYYTITSVVNASTVYVDTTENGIWTGATSLDYDIFSPVVYANKDANVASTLSASISAGASSAVAIVSVLNGELQTRGVQVGDIIAIVSSTGNFEGVYPITSVVSETVALVNDQDHPFTSVGGNDIIVYEAGMFLEYKRDVLSLAAVGNVTFASTTNKITRSSGSWTADGVTTGTIVTFASTTSNNISFTVASAGTTDIELVSTDVTRITDEGPTAGASVTAADGFKRTIAGVTYGFNWKLTGNNATLANCYQFIQHQLRQTGDIDWGAGTSRGDVTDLLLAFATPTGTTANLYIDDINADDTNNATYVDATGVSRLEAFVSSFTINHNTNLVTDGSAKVRMFFTNDDAGDNTGRDFGTSTAITVQDADGADVAYTVIGASRSFTFDYDGNTQRGAASAGEDAPVTIVAIGLDTAQYVITTGTITRAKGLTFSLVSPLERNYSNP